MSKKKVTKSKKRSIKTFNIHGLEKTKAWEFSNHLVPPITASTTFRLQSVKRGADGFLEFADSEKSDRPIWIYDRLEEPSTRMLEEQLAQMESGETAISFASGMGAISAALLCQLQSGHKILAHKTLYGCTYSLITSWLPRLGVNHELLSMNELSQQDLNDPSVRVVYFETVCNPSLEIIDLKKVVDLVKKANLKRHSENKIKIIVDNTFATPWGLRPLEHGVDMVVQSLTKNIAGFGTEMGGAIITYNKYLPEILLIRKDIGAMMSAHSAWNIMVYGISSQVLRFEKQQQSAMRLATYLERHPKIEKVDYPGLKSFTQYKLAKKLLVSPEGHFSPGTMLAFTLKGSSTKTEKFINWIAENSYTITLAVSLGLVKTLIEVPGLMTHSSVPKEKQHSSGIPEKLIRMSVGLEDVEDLISDLDEAFRKI